ncbi:GNAT family acetyltransferase [Planctomyces sp. SH-PL14]|jgi:ribosomal protein S18 acetylase RimI-like enzyme|uniref:GNAT family acetyltransferase n=1 Tax=Planctomyces sp. SH-PL14 TaxID=1632864 RepID=UPI00078CDDBA|nr:GNAT family acetyltransferase [Planctomyces sp. SH-PL14]AMV19281.1 Acetyltransferase YpeA [Planctomyces sp. SH-PL14]
MRVREFQDADEAQVIDVWRACGLTRPWNDPSRDIARKKQVQPDLFLVAEDEGTIVGTVMAGYEGHRGWINYLGVLPERQKSGIARALMDEAERRLRALGCPKINLQVRSDNEEALAFYARIGFQQDPVLSLGKRLVQDEPRPGNT